MFTYLDRERNVFQMDIWLSISLWYLKTKVNQCANTKSSRFEPSIHFGYRCKQRIKRRSLVPTHWWNDRVVAYISRTLTKCECRYFVTKKELLAVVHFVKHFRYYLCGKEFDVQTDHCSLKRLFQFKNPKGKLACWLKILSAYKFQIHHRPGSQHKNADALSRIPRFSVSLKQRRNHTSKWDKNCKREQRKRHRQRRSKFFF